MALQHAAWSKSASRLVPWPFPIVRSTLSLRHHAGSSRGRGDVAARDPLDLGFIERAARGQRSGQRRDRIPILVDEMKRVGTRRRFAVDFG